MSKLSTKPAPFKVTNLGTFAEINIIGEINWWSNSSADFTRQLAELRAAGVTELRGYINSPGGSLFDGNEIYNQIAAFPGRKTAVLGALVASAGTTIASAFTDGIEMAANGQYMIHNPCVYVEGGEKELLAGLQMYKNVRLAAINIYAKLTKLTPEELGEMMDATTWMTAEEAKAKGFITGIVGEDSELPADAAQVFNHYKVKNVPAVLNQAVLALTVSPNSLETSTMNKPALITMLGLSASATDTEVEMAVQAAATGAQNYTRLTNELQADRTRIAKERAEILVDNAVAAKKIPAGKRDAWVNNATTNFDSVKELIDSIAAPTMATNTLVPDTEIGKVTNETGTGTEGDRSKWTLKDYQEKDGKALVEMAEKDPAKYRTLVANAYPTPGKK